MAIIILVFVYFLPSLCAINKKGGAGIVALNILLGWTFLGWVIALVWALAAEKEYPTYETERNKRIGQILCLILFAIIGFVYLVGTLAPSSQTTNTAKPTPARIINQRLK